MAESAFDIFGDHHMRQATKNTIRQPLSNIENLGKSITTGPIKPNETGKKGDAKKSFLSNAGKTLHSTPMRQAFSPKPVNIASVISCDDKLDKGCNLEELEFTRPRYMMDNYNKDVLDFLLVPEPKLSEPVSPPGTPEPVFNKPIMEAMTDEEDDIFSDDLYENVPMYDSDLSLPEIDFL